MPQTINTQHEATHLGAPSLATPSFNEAFWYWLKLGLISFGGPAGQIAIMHHDLVDKKRWISDKRFLHALNFCMVLPGPEAQQLTIYLGWLLHRTKGGIVAGLLFILPSFILLIALAFVYLQYGQLPLIAAIFYAIKPAVIAIIFSAAWRIGQRTLTNSMLWLIACGAFIAIAIFKIAFPWIMLSVLFIGVIGGRLKPTLFKQSATAHPLVANAVSAEKIAFVIDDHTPVAQHTRFNCRYAFQVLAVGLALWCSMMLTLTVAYGWHGALTQMGLFFTKAALLTFGGAYAVLPYLYQGAVDYYHWLSPLQMIDGLALGEATPGPLIMVVTFVGFIGGWGQVFTADLVAAFSMGMLAATIATFFTFLPSFVFILLSAPFIEKTQNNVYFTAPLTAITAAVVGVILSLALFFALHIFLPYGYAIDTLILDIDWLSVGLTCLGLIVLLKYKVNIIYMLLAYMILGLIKYWLT